MLNDKQIKMLLQLAGSVTPDALNCDDCFGEIARFAEEELAGHTVCEAMRKVQNHLANCPCCRDEYRTLLEALRGMRTGEATPENAT